jgi:hypothetical protein
MLSFVVLIAPVRGATRVTVAQLEHFLTSSRAAKLSDAEIADRLSQVRLSEQLTAAALKRISSERELGSETAEQIELLAAASIFESPPALELPEWPPPDAATQAEIVRAARDSVNGAVHLLPDFLAVRVTRSFDNLPITEGKKHTKPKIAMHFVGEFRREISIRSGREVHRPFGDARHAVADQPAGGGFSTWGEFGAILAIVLRDSFNGSVAWSRWQKSEAGTRVAVFRYAVPRAASHDTVDFCCYAELEDAPAIYSFHDKPGYHGEIYVDLASGEIDRITLEAELNESDPVTRSEVAVEYGAVSIAGRRYVCPIWSVAVSEVHNLAMRKIDGVGLEEHVNVVQFGEYHKFGSTARIMTDPQ